MTEREEQRTILRENFGESLRTKRRQELMNMSIKNIKRKLAESGWRPRPVTMKELLAGIEDIVWEMDVNFKR
jgi:hypothetical protein